MARDKDKLRRRLFGLYAANLSIHQPKHADLFGCPICFQTFNKVALDPPKGFDLGVDLAHCFPKAIGGKLFTLTCRDCNSRIGTKYDSHTAKQHKLHNIFAGVGKHEVPTRIEYDGGSVNAMMVRDGEKTNIVISDRNCNPAEFAKLGQQLRMGFKFNTTFEGYSPKRNFISLIHSAYLLCFYVLGYEYPFFAETKFIRDLLTAETMPESFGVPIIQFAKEKHKPEMDAMCNKLCFTFVNQKWVCMSVSFAIPHSTIPIQTLLLPAFGTLGRDHYQQLQRIEASETQIEFAAFPYDDPFEWLSKSDAQGYGRSSFVKFVNRCGIDLSPYIKDE